MWCENVFCVYWEDDVCSLGEVSLDIQGTCQECIYLNIPSDILKKERFLALNRLEYDEDLEDENQTSGRDPE